MLPANAITRWSGRVLANPANLITGVSLAANAEATFSEAMDPRTLTTGTFTLTKQYSSTPVAASVNYSSTLPTSENAPSPT